MTASDATATRWCTRCERHIVPVISIASTGSDQTLVRSCREACPVCVEPVHEAVTGPGALAWAKRHGVEVVPS